MIPAWATISKVHINCLIALFCSLSNEFHKNNPGFNNVGYVRSGFEYFLKGFGPVHSPTQTNFSPSRSRQALSNQYHFNIKVHFHTPENPKKPKKKCKIKRNFVKHERIRPDALSNVETYINR